MSNAAGEISPAARQAPNLVRLVRLFHPRVLFPNLHRMGVMLMATWPYLLIGALDIVAISNGQARDLLRRELSTMPTTIVLCVALVAFRVALVYGADRSFLIRAEVATRQESSGSVLLFQDRTRLWRWILGSLMAVLLVASEVLVHHSLNSDVLKTPLPGHTFWAIGSPAFSILAIVLSFKIRLTASLDNWKWLSREFDVHKVNGFLNRFFKNWLSVFMGFAFVVIAVLGGLGTHGGYLKTLSEWMARDTLALVHGILAFYCMLIVSIKAFTRHFRIPAFPTFALILGIGTTVLYIVSLVRPRQALDLQVVPSLKTPVEPISISSAYNRANLQIARNNGYIVIFVSEGGGIHALYRAGETLALMEQSIPGGIWGRLFATSTVSGGSVGTAMFGALRGSLATDKVGAFLMSSKPTPTVPPRTLPSTGGLGVTEQYSAFEDVIASDLLTPVIYRHAFCDPIAFLGNRNLDPGKALLIGAQGALERMDSRLRALSRTVAPPATALFDLGISDMGTASNTGAGVASDMLPQPYYCFNTTSSKTGRRFVLTALDIPYVDTPASYPGTEDVSIGNCATLSARFPGFPGAGRLRVGGPDGTYDRLLDGGLYDNSGLMTAFDLIQSIRRINAKQKFILIVVGNNLEPLEQHEIGDGSQPTHNVPLPSMDTPFAGLVAFITGSINVLREKNSEASHDLAQITDFVTLDNTKSTSPFPKSRRGSVRPPLLANVEVINFIWDGAAINAPLGWYMDIGRGHLLKWMLGSREIPPEAQDLSVANVHVRPIGTFYPATTDRKSFLMGIRAHNQSELARLAALVDPTGFAKAFAENPVLVTGAANAEKFHIRWGSVTKTIETGVQNLPAGTLSHAQELENKVPITLKP